ncbi:MAG: Ig-like domain-containing protein, partial [Propionibacteriaceae bacterium]|nr:Ig-like domain-containing protein [Propionibacteriaceae bacterium]
DEKGNTVCTAAVQANKTWSCTPTNPLDDGDHTLTATEKDTAGNVSQPSPPVNISIDTVAPVPPVITDPATGGKPINNTTPPIKGTGEEEGNEITVYDGKNPTPVCTAVVQADLTWSCIPDAPLGDGDHSLTAKEEDKAGNISDPSAPVVVTIRTTAPSDPVVDETNGSVVTGMTDPDTTVTVHDEDGNPIPGCINIKPAAGKFVCTPEIEIPAGSELTVVATDPAGNESRPVDVEVLPLIAELQYDNRLPGESQVVTGRHFNPGERVCMSIDGDPTNYGCQTANDEGVVTFAFTIPANVPVGRDTIHLTGETSGGAQAHFIVAPRPVVAVKTGGTSRVSDLSVPALAGLVMVLAGLWILPRVKRSGQGRVFS